MSVIPEPNDDLEAARLEAIARYQKKSRVKLGFYRPHDHKGFDNVDPATGEVMPSMTRQSEMEGCDIHNILKQFSQVGFEELVRQNAARGQYADLTDLPDYQDALNIVRNADAAFAALPSQVRERFLNDPQRFVEFLADPENAQEAIRLGLAQDVSPKPDPITKVQVVPGDDQVNQVDPK